jgi:hypothetical protein
MHSTFMPFRTGLAGLLLALGLQPSLTFAQGSLTPPPGAPAPGLRTLQQIEPRIPLQGGSVPSWGVYLFNISAPGAYFLTADVVVPSGFSGVRIAASDVVLDLNGFAVRGAAGAVVGILVESSAERVTVRGGSILGFGTIGLQLGPMGRAEDLTLADISLGAASPTSAAIMGLFVGTSAARVRVSNGGGHGILLTGTESSAEDCVVRGLASANLASLIGIRADRVRRCAVSIVSSSASGSVVRGISAGDVDECTVRAVSGAGNVIGIAATGSVFRSAVFGFGNAASVSVSSFYYGIEALRVVDCRVVDIRATGVGGLVFVGGIRGTHVSGCVVERVEGLGTATTNTTFGIRANLLSSNFAGTSAETALIRGNMVGAVTGFGIQVAGAGIVAENRVLGATTGISAGFGHVFENTVTQVTTGISSGGSAVVRGNIVQAATGTAYSLSSGVRSGPTITTGGVGSTFDPNANFAFP